MALGFSNNEINRDFKIENVFKKIRFSDLFFFFV
jgi:hypothetical protein